PSWLNANAETLIFLSFRLAGNAEKKDKKTCISPRRNLPSEENDARPKAFFSILVFDPGRETVWGSAFLGLAF
ncbi:hypothetical protein JYG56_24170, partial [Escherichia fergusonii]|nr:hypothetical protein [Escherichia fergusonii]